MRLVLVVEKKTINIYERVVHSKKTIRRNPNTNDFELAKKELQLEFARKGLKIFSITNEDQV